MNNKSEEHVPSIKPLLHRIDQVIVEKEILLALVELNPHNHLEEKYYHSGVWFQTKEITKQGDRRRDFKEGFAEMNKY
jgi:hypothetical protein